MKTLLIATVSEFFRQRAGMFFVLIGILFGFLSGAEHHSFAVFFLTGKSGMLYLLAIWLSYTLLCIHFLLNLWKKTEYGFVYHSRLWGTWKRFRRFEILALGFIQPLLFYGIYLIVIAVQDKLPDQVWPILSFLVFLSLLIAAAAEWRIRNPRLSGNRKQRIALAKFPRPNAWIYWSLEWLIREKGITLLICKTGAALVFTGTLLYYGSGTYDLRLPAIGLSMGYLLNSGLSYELYRWENEIWLWNRTLPLSVFFRFSRILLLHVLIMLPETLLIFRYQLLEISEVMQLFGLGISIVVLLHVYLYKKRGLLEDSIQTVLIGFVILTLLILYKIPLLIIAAAALVYSFVMYPKWYA